jgi:hypothetical protein
MRLRIAADQLGNIDGKRNAAALAAVALGVVASQGCGNSSPRTTDTAGMDAGAPCPLAAAAGDAGGQCLCPSATNLLPEPGFDTDVNDWQQNGGANFSSTDATGCSVSGSLQLSLVYGIPTNVVTLCPVSVRDTREFARETPEPWARLLLAEVSHGMSVHGGEPET